jgi:hypothetical protein
MAANTAAAPTFAPNGLTAHTIVKAGGALVANDIITTAQACAVYNTTGTHWELDDPQTVSSSSGGAVADVYSNGAVILPHATSATPGVVVSTATSHTDGYVCPATNPTGGATCRCIVQQATAFNTTGGSVNVYPEIKISGTYYPLGSLTSAATVAAVNFAIAYVMEPGETLAFNTNSTASVNFTFDVKVIDDTAPIKSAKLTSYASGNNTLYTCATGKVCEIYGATNMGYNSQTAIGVRYINNTGSARAIGGHLVPNGGSVGTANKIFNVASVTTSSNVAISSNMAAGDFINFVTDSTATTQFAWVNVSERAQ